MEDFRLKVFYSVAQNQSFSKAAAEMFITQPAVTKHIKILEDELGLRLFDRGGNVITLTRAGEVLYRYAGQIFNLYQEALFELGTFKDQLSGSFRLGASTTIAQYIISPILASFHEKFPQIELNLMNANTEAIEQAVLAKNIDLGIVEGKKHNTMLKYVDFAKDELVAVVHNKSRFGKLQDIRLDDLTNIPLVLRERGSGTLEVIESALKDKGIKLTSLKIIMHLGSTESIKSFLEHANCMGFVSIRAIQKELASNQLKIIPIQDFKIPRTFSFVHLQGQPEGLSATFMKFASRKIQQD